MKLTKVTITGFRSIRETLSLDVDERITILIGANDQGKTNLLEAIRAFNDDRSIKEEDKNWDLESSASANIEYSFALDDAEFEQLRSKYGEEPFTKSVLDGQAIASPISREVTFVRRDPKNALEVRLSSGKEFNVELRTRLLNDRPRVELFAPSEQQMDSVTLQQLTLPNFECMAGLFMYAGLWKDRDKLFSQNPRTSRLLQDASLRLTDLIREEWQQDDSLEFDFRHTGQNGNTIELLTKDQSVQQRFIRPSARSEGFSWFFKMHMRLLARQATSTSGKFIFLFDEPGMYLHPLGQVSLQRVFERLSEKNQVAYTTHSIFMINHNRQKRNRVISKRDRGTVVDQKPYAHNWKSARESLGLLFAGSFFFADVTLLVEGDSDVQYIASMLSAYDRWGKLDVDLNLFSIQAAGNAKDAGAMARLMCEEGRCVVVLIDGDGGGKAIRKQIEEVNADIEARHVNARNIVEAIELEQGRSTEDFLPFQEKYVGAVIATAFELVERGHRQWSRVAPSGDRERMLEQLRQKPESRTLGNHVDTVTKQWFTTKDSLSKVAIARHYCDALDSLVEAPNIDPPAFLREIVRHLKLESKRSKEDVFEKEML